MDPIYVTVFFTVSRYVFAMLGVAILFCCAVPLLGGRQNRGWDLVTLGLVTIFQGMNGLGFLLVGQMQAALGFWVIMILQWTLLMLYILFGKGGFSLETLLFFLCSVGIGAVAAVKPEEVMKQVAAMGIGVGVYLLVLRLISHGYRAQKWGYGAAAVGIGLLVLTLILGKESYGAKSWLILGPVSVQPSEIVKLCFVYAGSMFLHQGKKGVVLLMLYAAVTGICLIWMNDFGSAAVFFAAFVMMVLLHSGVMTALGICATGICVGIWKMPAHALRRFAVWRHIWQQPLAEGFQQTRGLMSIAAGGMLGMGIGAGRMGRIFAADSDLVFATICETWGLAVGALPVAAMVVLLVYAVKMGQGGNEMIAGCGAVTMLAVQAVWNIFGTVDLLPMTGVTLPFVSNGGSSMVASWGLAAFVKAMEGDGYGKTI